MRLSTLEDRWNLLCVQHRRKHFFGEPALHLWNLRKTEFKIGISLFCISFISSLVTQSHWSIMDTNSDSDSKNNKTETSKASVTMSFWLLSLCFLCCYTPQNALAPNLTSCGIEFDITTTSGRDYYLGTILSLCQHVFSLPIAAYLGYLTDTSNRIKLFSAITFAVGFFSILTSVVQSFVQLAIVRLLTGGFYTGGVVVVFSVVSDMFDIKRRNGACAALAAAMGTGVLIGQLVAGLYGEDSGWRYSFAVLGVPNLLASVSLYHLVDDPLRGGKESALKELINEGGTYNEKLSWAKFKAMMQNRTTFLLIIQR